MAPAFTGGACAGGKEGPGHKGLLKVSRLFRQNEVRPDPCNHFGGNRILARAQEEIQRKGDESHFANDTNSVI